MIDTVTGRPAALNLSQVDPLTAGPFGAPHQARPFST